MTLTLPYSREAFGRILLDISELLAMFFFLIIVNTQNLIVITSFRYYIRITFSY